MSEYSLLGKLVSFSIEEERHLDLFCKEQVALITAKKRYEDWYINACGIETVLTNGASFAGATVAELVLQPLFQELAGYEIYDVSWDAYIRECARFPHTADAIQAIQADYDQIVQQQRAKEEYRANRKENRSRWSGGGFGLGNAIKGAAEAAALNAVSGLGHSAFNAVGNAGSAALSSGAKWSLYKAADTKASLVNALCFDIELAFANHEAFLNCRKRDVVVNSFDIDRSGALFGNAKNIPEKREILLIEAFRLCPWNASLLQYVFINFPADRVTVAAIAKRFSVDLSLQIESVISEEYTDQARLSELEAKRAQARIIAIMKEFGVSESATLDTLETDCLERICKGYEDAGEADCQAMIRKIKDYEVREKSKQPFLQKIQQRIESIWSAEDGEIFDNLYLQTDLTDPQAISESVAYIQSKARTASSEKYVAALQGCTPKTIKNARLYKYSNRPKIYIALAIASIVICFFDAFIIGIPAAIIFFFLERKLKKSWNLLTINGTVIHPVLTGEPTKSDTQK